MGKWMHRLTEVDLEQKTAICAECGPTGIRVSGKARRCLGAIAPPEPTEKIGHYMVSRDVEARVGVCQICGPVPLAFRKGSWGCPARRGDVERLRMTVTKRQSLRDGKPCEICGVVEEKMALDHKHGETRARGVLCMKHNTGLGMFDDDPDLLDAAAKYLRKHV